MLSKQNWTNFHLNYKLTIEQEMKNHKQEKAKQYLATIKEDSAKFRRTD